MSKAYGPVWKPLAAALALSACAAQPVPDRLQAPFDRDDNETEPGRVSAVSSSGVSDSDDVLTRNGYRIEAYKVGTAPELGAPEPTTLINMQLPDGRLRQMAKEDMVTLKRNLSR